MPKAEWSTEFGGDEVLSFEAVVHEDGHFFVKQNGERIGQGVTKPIRMAQKACERIIQSAIIDCAEEANADD